MITIKPFLSLLTLLFLTVSMDPVSSSSPAIKAAYWPSWSENLQPSGIDTSLFTHILYAFAMPHNTTYTFNVSESENLLFKKFTSDLHHKKPPVKAILSIGGGGTDSSVFARMASESSTRRSFINSAIEVARKYGFDGLDLDWEFPENTKEMKDLGILFEEWRIAVEKEAKATGRRRLLLSAAVYYSVEFLVYGLQRSYPAASINKNLDWASPMCFDYHGSWDTSETGAHAALFDPNSNISTSYGVDSWIKAGVHPQKLVMGLPLYAHTWKLANPKSNGIGAPAIGVGPGDEDGTMTYSQVVDFNKKNGATAVYDATTVSAYSFAGNSWIGYDDATSVTKKIGFARAHNLRGYFFWAVHGDKDWEISKQASKAWGR